MSVKFKLGFTVSAETLFTLMSKLLPIEDLSVEEVIERPDPNVTRIAKVEQLVARKPKKKFTGKRYTLPFNPKKGINGIILGHLDDGFTHRTMELRPLLKAQGYSESSVASRLENLHKRGLVHKVADGIWRIVEHPNASDKRKDTLSVDTDAMLPHAAVLGQSTKA